MNLQNLLSEYLVTECGFADWQVETRYEHEVVVYLSGRKLHFVISDGHLINCCLMRGGMATPNNIYCLRFCAKGKRTAGRFVMNAISRQERIHLIP